MGHWNSPILFFILGSKTTGVYFLIQSMYSESQSVAGMVIFLPLESNTFNLIGGRSNSSSSTSSSASGSSSGSEESSPLIDSGTIVKGADPSPISRFSPRTGNGFGVHGVAGATGVDGGDPDGLGFEISSVVEDDSDSEFDLEKNN